MTLQQHLFSAFLISIDTYFQHCYELSSMPVCDMLFVCHGTPHKEIPYWPTWSAEDGKRYKIRETYVLYLWFQSKQGQCFRWEYTISKFKQMQTSSAYYTAVVIGSSVLVIYFFIANSSVFWLINFSRILFT